MRRILVGLLVLLCSFTLTRADEGMWIPILLDKLNIEDMQAKGLKLSAEDIYSINQASLKDAIVIFGRGCTGEIVSNDGLLFTNYHCGHGAIQKHSSVEQNYLTDGFWAMNRDEELPNASLSVTFLVRMEDVTEGVLNGVKNEMTEQERAEVIADNIEGLRKKATKGTHYSASIKPFFYGNQYFLFVYEKYTDVRLVGAPPSAIGEFGGDTDNWMWPRHTGDFSIFRIYADKDNKPAKYSPDNVPYKPKKFFSISAKGIEKGDFTFVMGYPGSTSEYLTSYAVDLILNQRNPHRIALRECRLEIMNSYINKSDKIRIQYASKQSGVSNSWKRWKGQNRGLNRVDAVSIKQEFEKGFQAWADENEKNYSGLLSEFENTYTELKDYYMAADYYKEAISAVEIMKFALKFEKLVGLAIDGESKKEIKSELAKLHNQAKSFYKDYNNDIDREVFLNMVSKYFANVDKRFYPELFSEGTFDADKFAKDIFQNSLFVDESKINQLLEDFPKDKAQLILDDPAFQLAILFKFVDITTIKPVYNKLESRIDSLHRLYMTALMEYQKDKVFYPDANFTMRITYGQVDDYYPRDAVHYKYYTTLDGIMEKDDPSVYDYDVPERLRELYRTNDFGDYADNGEMRVCFTASNHTAGGNSGSPVINVNGELIGLNFDRNWEGTMNDIMYDPEQCRNISLDVKYVLFIIDKYAGASYLFDEMDIVK